MHHTKEAREDALQLCRLCVTARKVNKHRILKLREVAVASKDNGNVVFRSATVNREEESWKALGRHTHTPTFTFTHTHTQTHTHPDTQTHRHPDTQTHRHTHTFTHVWMLGGVVLCPVCEESALAAARRAVHCKQPATITATMVGSSASSSSPRLLLFFLLLFLLLLFLLLLLLLLLLAHGCEGVGETLDARGSAHKEPLACGSKRGMNVHLHPSNTARCCVCPRHVLHEPFDSPVQEFVNASRPLCRRGVVADVTRVGGSNVLLQGSQLLAVTVERVVVLGSLAELAFLEGGEDARDRGEGERERERVCVCVCVCVCVRVCACVCACLEIDMVYSMCNQHNPLPTLLHTHTHTRPLSSS